MRDVNTIKRLWMNDTDVRNEHFSNYVARPKSIDEWWIYNDVHKWHDYTKKIVNFETLQKMEDRSWRENSSSWKIYRTWKRQVRKSYLSGNAVNLQKAFPSFGADQMPKRPKPTQPAPLSGNRTDRLFHPVKGGWEAAFLVEGMELGLNRLAIMDSGCSSDTHPMCLAKLRTLVNPVPLTQLARLLRAPKVVPLNMVLGISLSMLVYLLEHPH